MIIVVAQVIDLLDEFLSTWGFHEDCSLLTKGGSVYTARQIISFNIILSKLLFGSNILIG